MISIMQKKINKFILSIIAILFWLLVWQIAASIVNKNLMFKIPLPIETITEFISFFSDITFWQAVLNSVFHIVTGFVLGVIIGFIFGILSSNSIYFNILTSPISRLIRTVPVAAFIILAWLWIPAEYIPAFISFLMVLPIIWSQVESGLLSVDSKLVEMADVMGMGKIQIIKNIKIPVLLPFVRNSLITGLGFAWKSGVAAEVICNSNGSVGAMLSSFKSNLEYRKVFAVVVTIIILSLILENIIKIVWREKCD